MTRDQLVSVSVSGPMKRSQVGDSKSSTRPSAVTRQKMGPTGRSMSGAKEVEETSCVPKTSAQAGSVQRSTRSPPAHGDSVHFKVGFRRVTVVVDNGERSRNGAAFKAVH